MVALERTYTIPLRREWLKVQRYKRAKKAVAGVREFLQRHMKSEDVRLGLYLNLELWKHGIRNPPSRVRVTVVKDDKGVVRAELFGAPVEKKEAVASEKKVGKGGEKKSEPKKGGATVIDVTPEAQEVKKEEKREEEVKKKSEAKKIPA